MSAEHIHTLSDGLLYRPVEIHVVGCGGTGSQLLPRLAQLDHSMRALGHPHGLHITVWDSDTVSAHNCLRQNFFFADLGANKATVMVNRLNIAHGLAWRDQPYPFARDSIGHTGVDFIIGCVDTKGARREIDACVRAASNPIYWIDAGNDAASGQVVVGQFGARIAGNRMRLPLVTELYPEIVEGEDDAAPSCSAHESIHKQGLATNAMAATWIYAWLAEALRFGRVAFSGVFFNLATGRTSPIPVDPAAWAAIRPASAAEIQRI